jgi:hypothetical protein
MILEMEWRVQAGNMQPGPIEPRKVSTLVPWYMLQAQKFKSEISLGGFLGWNLLSS